MQHAARTFPTPDASPETGTHVSRHGHTLSTAAFHAALTVSQDAMVVMSSAGVVTFANAATDRHLQRPVQAPPTLWNWLAFWPSGSREKAHDAFKDALRGVGSDFEAFGPTLKGAPRWWSVRVAPVCCEGKVISVTASMKDVSGFVWTEQELARLIDLTAEEDGASRQERQRASRVALLLRDLSYATIAAGSAPEASHRRISIASDIWSCGDVIEKGLVSAPAVIGMGLRSLAAAGVLPYVCGAETALAPEPAAVLAIALDEFSRNALAHRGLQPGRGQVRLAWSHSTGPDATLDLRWTETGEDALPEPAPSGFGTKHLDAVVHASGGHLRREWTARGLTVHLTLPL